MLNVAWQPTLKNETIALRITLFCVLVLIAYSIT